MKKFVTTTLIGLVAIGSLVLASAAADARPYHRSGARVGIYFGTGILAAPWVYGRPYYYGPYAYPYPYPYYGYAPTYYPRVVQEQPTVYVESQAPVAASPAPQAPSAPQAQQQYWYFCQSSQTYYPHVQNCATPWQRVIPHAPQ